MNFSTLLKRLATVTALGLPLAGQAQTPFMVGRLVVAQAASNVGATTVTLQEYTTSGTAGLAVALPAAASGANKQFRILGSSTTEGGLNLSGNGQFLTIGGYDAAAGATLPGTAAALNRVVARVDAGGSVNTTTALTDAFASGNIRSVVSNDGTQFYLSGSAEGVRYAATLGATTTTLVSSTVTNLRQVHIAGGNLYFTTASGATRGTYQVGTGLPTATGTTATSLLSVGAAAAPNATTFVDLDADGNPDVAYLVDASTTGTTGGIYKFSRTGATWTARGQVASTAGMGFVAGRLNGANVELYITTPTSILPFSEPAANATATIGGTPGTAIATTLATTPFRGIAFVPVSSSPVNTALTIANGTFSSTAANANSNSTAFTLSNSSATAQTVTITTSGAPFSYAGGTISVPAQVGATPGTATFVVNFAPTTAGTFTGTVTAAVTGFQNVVSSSFSATGTAPANTALTITNGTFTSTAAGSNSQSSNFTLSNSSATAQSVTLNTSGAPFTATTPTTVSVPATGSATFTVTFAPTAAGTFTGTVTAVVSGFQNVVSGSFSATATAASAVPTIASATTSTLLAGIQSNVSLSGTNLSGASVTISGSTAGTVTVGTVTGSATTANFTLLAPGAGGFTATVTTSGGSVTQAFTVTTPPTGFFEPFEAGSLSGYPLAASPTTLALTAGSFTFVQALLGNITPVGDRKNQGQSVRLRGGGTVTFTKTGGVGTLSLAAGQYAADVATFTLGYRPAGSAAAFTPVAGTPAALTATLTTYSFPLNLPGSIEIQIGTSNTTVGTNPRLNIDDLAISNFTGFTDLTVTTPQTISGSYNNVTVASGGVATLGGTLTVSGALVVQSGGTLNLACQTIAGAGTVTVSAGATLAVCDAAGLPATAGRSYSPDASYLYNGTVAQTTGAGLPATVLALTVANTAGLTLSAATSVSQLLALTSGNLATGGNALTLRSVDGQGSAVVDNTGGIVVGQVTVQRAVDQTPVGTSGNTGYHHYSAPVANTTLPDLDITGSFVNTYNPAYNTALEPGRTRPFPTVFGYDETRLASSPAVGLDAFSKGWFSPLGSEAMAVGRGYSANIPNALVVDFVGTLNNGPLTIAGLTRGADAGAGFHLVGNPSPASLNWDNVAAARRAGLDAAMYVFNSTGPYSGTYRSRANGVGGSPLITSATGFFVRTLPGQTGAINLLNTDRETTFGAQPAFGRGTADVRPLLRLTLANAAGTLADDAFVYCQAGATLNADAQFDATKLPNPSGLNLATRAGAQALAINGLPVLGSASVLLPLAVAVPAAGAYAFTAASLANFGSATLVLRDALTGTRTALTAGSVYRFTAASATANGRFVLEINPAAAPLASVSQALAALVQVYPNPARGAFHLTVPASAKAATVLLTNALGQTVLTRTLTSAEADFNTSGLAVGVYTLRLAVEGAVITRKVVVE